MAVTIVPTQPNTPRFSERVSLDGTTFLLRFRWNTRLSAWFMDVFDDAELPIVYARRIVIDWPLLRQTRYRDDGPAGEVLAYDTTNRDVRPLLDDLGVRVLLGYLDAESVALSEQ